MASLLKLTGRYGVFFIDAALAAAVVGDDSA
jgi:hypothetical protein